MQLNIRFYLVMLLLPMLYLGCKSQSTISRATSQEMIGGAPGSGFFSIYRVYVDHSGGEALTIDGLYLGTTEFGEEADFAIFADSSYTRLDKVGPEAGQYRIEFRSQTQGGDNMSRVTQVITPAPKDLPADFQKGVVVFYTRENGKSGRWVVGDIARLEPIAMP